MKEETVYIRTEYEWDIEPFGIGQGLLHAGAYGMGIILNLDNGVRATGFVEEDIICAFIPGPGMQFSKDNYPSFG